LIYFRKKKRLVVHILFRGFSDTQSIISNWLTNTLEISHWVPSEDFVFLTETPPKATEVFSSGIQNLDQILDGGYPENSSILVMRPSGIGKESLGYWFVTAGMRNGDYSFYVTHRPVSDVLKNMKAFLGGVPNRLPEWMASAGSEKRCDLNDPTSISFNMKKILQGNRGKRIRIATDVLSPLFLLNPPENMYRYFSQLIAEMKQHNVVFLAIVDEGMHPQSVLASMEQLFDGVIELKIYEQGLSLTPVLRIKKMLGLQPFQDYFRFSFTQKTMEIVQNVSH
jgi:KaiC/GvpD/RAD55 family RecA-like ATPase